MSKRWMSALAACLIAVNLCACTGMRGNVSDDPNGKVNNYGNGAYDTGTGNSTGTNTGSSNSSTGSGTTAGGTQNGTYGSANGNTNHSVNNGSTADRKDSGENALNDLKRAAKETGNAVKRALR